MFEAIGKLAGCVVPAWARWLAILCLAAAAGGLCWLKGDAHRQMIDDARIARIEDDHAQVITRIAQAGAASAQRNANTLAAQSAAKQEIDHASTQQRAALDRRIAAGGLRITATFAAPGRGAVPTVSTPSGSAAEDAGKLLPADAGGSAGTVPPAVGQAVLAGSARDAQQTLQLMDFMLRMQEAYGQQDQ